jgi:hypothetical protein
MRPIATLVISLAMALGAIGLAVAAPGGLGGGQERARFEAEAASGAVSISNSRAGQAVFNAAAMRPGEGVSGVVTIGNNGDRAGRFGVQATGVEDAAGPYGGKLSQRVELVLFDVTNVQSPKTVFAGSPADFAQVDLGALAPGRQRNYLFAATLPDTAGNSYQGAALSLGFQWSATNVATSTPTPPVATPTPTPATPTPTPTPTAPPPVPLTLADALGMPPTKSCIKRGKLKLRVKAPARAKVVSAVIKVNGKVKAKRKGAKASRPVTLRGLKKRTKLSITVKASNKRTYSATRTYKPCKR